MSWTEWGVVTGDGLDDFKEIIYEKKQHAVLGGGVARVSLNKPEKMNTLTMSTVEEMFRAFYDANHDSGIGVIIVAARGKHFGAGGDVDWERWGLREAFYNRYPHNRLMRMSRKPIIAQVQGYCIAGHNHMAYCCDFTIAADNAVFGQAGPRVSSPADGFFVPYLTKVVGAKKAREMWMLCRKYKADQALAMGLVNAVVQRSYSLSGDHIRCEIFPNRIEIESPGRFPGLVDPSRPLDIARYARNPRIARVCSDLNIGRELGEGIHRIFDEMRLAGLTDPIYEQTPSSVRLVLRASAALPAEVRAQLPKGSEHVLSVMRQASQPLSTGDLVELVGLSRPSVAKSSATCRARGSFAGPCATRGGGHRVHRAAHLPALPEGAARPWDSSQPCRLLRSTPASASRRQCFLCAACLVTPSASATWDQNQPDRNAAFTAATSIRSASIRRAATDARRSAMSRSLVVVTTSNRACQTTIVNHGCLRCLALRRRSGFSTEGVGPWEGRSSGGVS